MENYLNVENGLVYKSTGLVKDSICKGLVEVLNESSNEVSFYEKSSFKKIFKKY